MSEIKQTIPKTIHYCWFGKNPKPPLIVKCMDSWKKVLPEYEIIEWNEDNFDVTENRYVKEAYENRKWAFVTDYVRLKVLYEYGGIYLDSDVEVLKPIDEFLSDECFSGFESKDTVPTAIMGSTKGAAFMKELLTYYDDKAFVKPDGSFDMTANTITITNMCKCRGLKPNGKKQTINGFTLYPQRYFCPNSPARIFNKKPIGAYTIHHSMGSWGDNPKYIRNFPARVKRYFTGVLRKIIGSDKTSKLRKRVGVK